MNFKVLFKQAGFALKKAAPDILVAAGIGGTIFGVVKACQATTKLEPIIDQFKEEKASLDNSEVKDDEYNKKLTKTYLYTGKELAKLYAPSAAIIGGSITCIIGSHSMLTKRNAAIAAAYATVDSCFKKYRKNVIAKYGEAIDTELRYGFKEEKPKKGELVDPEAPKKVKMESDYNTESDYAKFFDENSPYFEKNAEYNQSFLKLREREADDKLKAEGYLFLNDVYASLGIPKTEAGQVVGWIYDEQCPNGDNYVDFGIYDINSESSRNFVNGVEPRILLDFNVDGYILDKVPFLSRI